MNVDAPLLIVNADDFGMTPGISAGILAAHHHGIVSSTSVLANGNALPAFAHRLRDTERLGIGVHLAAVGEDPPLLTAAEIPSLVDRSGRFAPTWRAFLSRSVRGRVDADDIAREFRAQLDRVQGLGLPVSHLDAHQHLHLWPLVRDVVLDLAIAAGIPAIRAPRYRRFTAVGITVTTLCRTLTRAADALGIAYTEDSVGIAVAGHVDLATLSRVLPDRDQRAPASLELTVHPGAHGDPDRSRYAWGYDWEHELRTLTSPHAVELITERGLRLGTYANLVAEATSTKRRHLSVTHAPREHPGRVVEPRSRTRRPTSS